MGRLSMELYLGNLVKRYRTGKRKQKSEILAELCAVSGYHKKHAIRLLNKQKYVVHGELLFSFGYLHSLNESTHATSRVRRCERRGL